MNLEDFRKDIESKLNQIAGFELQEFHFKTHSFRNWILTYQIKGRIHKFTIDRRKCEITWLISKSHQKYFGAYMTEHKKLEGLEISSEQLKNGIKTVHNPVYEKIA